MNYKILLINVALTLILLTTKAYTQVNYYGPFQQEGFSSNPTFQQTYDAIITKNGENLITCGSAENIKVWNLRTKELVRYFKGSDRPIRSIALSPDEKMIACGKDDSSMIIFNFGDGTILSSWHDKKIFPSLVKYITFSKDGKRLFAKLDTRMPYEYHGIYCWNVLDGSLLATLDFVPGSAPGKIYSDTQGKTIFTSNQYLIDVNEHKVIRYFENGAIPINNDITKFFLFELSDIANSNGKKFSRSIFDVIENKITFLNEGQYEFNYIILSFSSSGRYGIIGNNIGDYTSVPKFIYDFDKGKIMYEIKELNFGPYQSLTFSEDQRFIIAISESNGAEVLDISNLMSSVKTGDKY